MESRQRQTAYKIWIKDIVDNKLIKQEKEWDPSYISFDKKNISRVNIIATVVFKYQSEDKNYCSVTADDGSGAVRLKVWKEDCRLLETLNTGDIILIIGRVREYNEEIYILPEVVKTLENPNWELARKLELIKNFGPPTKTLEKEEIKQEPKTTQDISEPSVEEEYIEDNQKQPTESVRQKILNVIEKFDTEEGVDKKTIAENLDSEPEKTDSAISELLKEGEIYESKPGKLKTTK